MGVGPVVFAIVQGHLIIPIVHGTHGPFLGSIRD
jgi:hypothetical protein